MIRHPKLETVYNIRDLEVGKCIPAMVNQSKYSPYIFNIGGDFDLEPNNILNLGCHVRSLFFIMIGYDKDGNKLLLADRGVVQYSIYNILGNNNLIDMVSNVELADYEIVTPYNVSTLDNQKYELFFSSEDSSYPALNIFKPEYNTLWQSGSDTLPHHIGLKFLDSPKNVNKIVISKINDNISYHNLMQFEFQGSNDGSDWTTLYEIDLEKNKNTRSKNYNQFIDVNNNSSYSMYRLLISKPSSLNNYGYLEKFHMFRKRTDDNDIKDYNFKLDLPHFMMMNSLKDLNIYNDDITLNEIFHSHEGTLLKGMQSNGYAMNWINNVYSTTIYVYSHSSDCNYRPVISCEPKVRGEIFSSHINHNNITESNASSTINVILDDNYKLPVEIKVHINGKHISSYDKESSSKNNTIEIQTTHLKYGDNIINVYFISKENRWLRSYNTRISYHPSGMQPLQSLSCVNTEDVDKGSFDTLDSGYGKESKFKDSIKFNFFTKNKSSISKIRSNIINSNKNIIKETLTTSPTDKVIDESIRLMNYGKVSDISSLKDFHIIKKKR